MPFMQMFNMPAQRGEEDEEEDGEYPQDELADGQMEPYESGEEQESQMGGARNLSAKERRQQEKERKKYKFLSAHCENLTLKAKDGKIDRIVGRDKEIERVIQILNRRTKNNPCLIGEPGVGKTAIAEGIAQRLADGNVPAMLQGKELYLLDMTSLVAGTQFRGQFESRVKGLLDDVRKVGNAILFIDEVHSLVGAGDAEGSMNAANILKPAPLPWRDSGHRCDHLRRVPQAHREGCCVGAPLPAGHRRPANHRADGGNFKGHQKILRGLPPRHRYTTILRGGQYSIPNVTSTTASCRTRPSTCWTRPAPVPT